ncbi:MAG: hypothetical protein ACYC2H_03445 [Thermoplasmatota archaeon]
MRGAVLVLGLVLMAGCAGPRPEAADPAPEVAVVTAARALDWSQSDCEAVTWSVPVTAAALQPYLPAGFEPSPPEASPAAIGAATLGFRAVECSYGFGEEKLVGSAQAGLLFTPVLPPAELREDRFTAHYAFGWDVLVAAEPWRDQAIAWGMPLRDGGAAVHPGAQGWEGSLALDQVGAFSMAGRPVGGDRSLEPVETRTITLGTQGFALWDSETVNATVTAGIGTWSASPESWVAEMLGATQGIATFERMTYDLPHAVVHWPGESFGPVEEGGDRPVGTLQARPLSDPVTVK